MLFYIFILVLVFLVYRIIKVNGRQKKNKEMLDILDLIDDEEAFFEKAGEYIDTQVDAEFNMKMKVLRLWADAKHSRKEDFEKHLEEIDMTVLLNAGKNGMGFVVNEDSFFYMYLTIPNRIYYLGWMDLLKKESEKMDSYADIVPMAMLKDMNEANRKYYNHEGDLGREFDRMLIEGEYSSAYKYNKQLVGIYKFTAAAMLARIALDEGNQDGFDAMVEEMRPVGSTPLGERWLNELGLVLPSVQTEEVAE